MALQRANGFPKISFRPDGGKEIQDRIYGTYSEMSGAPDFGDGHELDAQAYVVKKSDLQPSIGGATADAQIWYLDLLYGADSPEYVYSVEQSPVEKPIEFASAANCKTAFLMKWKYHLAAKTVATAAPSWYATATTPVIDDTDKALWRWINDAAELPKETDGTRWGIKTGRTKPGTDYFIMGSTIVKAQAWFASEENYESQMEYWVALDKAACVTPGRCFGLTDNARHWLLLPEKSGGRDGFYWTIAVKFMYSPEVWDSDLYA
jgi:hypothetical protein